MVRRIVKRILLAIFCCCALQLFVAITFWNVDFGINNIFYRFSSTRKDGEWHDSPLQDYLLNKHGHSFIGILETENELEFWSPIAVYQWRRNKIQPVFNIYRITNLNEEFSPIQSGAYTTELFISEGILSALKDDPTISGSYQNQAYSLYIFEREEKLYNISKIKRHYNNRESGCIRATTINVVNGLCYFDETFKLPQEFNFHEFSKTGIYSTQFQYLVDRNSYIQNIIAVSHPDFEYSYMFNFNVSEIDGADFFCFIGFKKLEAKVPYYEWGVYDTFEDIHLGRQYYNYQYFLIFPSYGFFGSESDSLTLLYSVDKQSMEEMMNSIVEDILE